MEKNECNGITTSMITMRARNGGRSRSGVDADEGPEEQAARQQEVQRHEHVPPVAAHEPGEQGGEVEAVEAADEDDRRHDRVGQELHVPAVDERVEPLAGPDLSRVARQRAQGERHRRSEHEEDRDDHAQEHVLHHVRAEHRMRVGREAGVGRDEQQPEAGEPRDGTAGRPAVAAAAQGAQAHGVERAEHEHHGEPESVEPSLAPQQPGQGRGGRQVEPEQDARG